MGAYVTINPTPSGDITGSGTAGYLAMFTSANAIGDSTINQASGNTGVGMAASANTGFGITTTAATSGTKNAFYFLQTGNTNQTASTEASGALWNMGTRQWATGAITSQREFYIQSCAYSFVGASVITDAYGLYVEAPTASTNATITNAYAAGFSGYVNVIADSSTIKIRSLVGTASSAAIYFNQTTPSATNYNILGTSTQTRVNGVTDVLIRVADSTKINLDTSSTSFIQAAATSGAVTPYSFTFGANTGQTASTEITNFKVTGNTKTWAAGAITTQRWNYFTANTAAFASASTISESIALAVEAATAGTNATITNNFALGLTAGTATLKFGHVTGDTTTAAIYLNQSTPSNTNYSIYASSSTTALNGASTGVALWVGGSERILAYGLRTSGSSSNFNFTTSNNTGMTASTEIPGYLYNSYSRQWATGALTTQREHYLKTVTYSFVGASTITNAYGLYVEAATAGTNATITNNYAAGFNARILSESTTVNVGLVLSRSTVLGFFQADSGSVIVGTGSAHNTELYYNNTKNFTFGAALTLTDAVNIAFATTTGTKIATATTQKLAFWNKTPIVQPTTAITGAARVGGGGAAVTDTDTFGGYTIAQLAAVIINTGLAA